MAIEFHCPYCTAVMRVPDSFAGRHGRCPKCDTVVIVPDVRPPVLTASDQAAPSVPVARTSAGHADTGMAAGDESGIPQIATAPAPPVSLALKRRGKRRGAHRLWMFGVPAICFLILLSAIGWFVVSRLPELSGDLPASLLAQQALDPVKIPWSFAGNLTDEQRETLVAELELNPEAFLSSQMSCRLTVVEEGIRVTLKSTDETMWYVVNPNQHTALVLWLKKNHDQLAAGRNRLLKNGLEAYCDQKLRVLSGELPVLDAARFRDEVGLTACCLGFGCVVQAVVQNRTVRCAYEDASGRLYFCLPRGIRSFTLNGVSASDGSRLFSGEFQVLVSEAVIPREEPASGPDEEPGEQPGAMESEPLEGTPPETPEASEAPETALNVSGRTLPCNQSVRPAVPPCRYEALHAVVS